MNNTAKQIKHLIKVNFMGIADKIKEQRKPDKRRRRATKGRR
tara:strand:+ start:665 stop:790 length:126 start_codon:yes stop_codon:yes gene_type:complete